jgi:ABC-type glycerol-3-phosphate transport system permease component
MAHSVAVFRQSPLKERLSRQLPRFLAYVVLVVGAVVISIPFFWMLSTAMKDLSEIYRIPPQLLPAQPRLDNFWRAMTVPGTPFTLYITNTLIVAAFSMLGTLTSNTVVAFAFSRLRWWGRNFWFAVMLSTIFLPAQVTIIPVYILFNMLGWIDTWNPLIVPHFFGSAVFIFLIRQFMMTIPLEMDDAARIDGCNTFQLFYHIILPLAGPVIATVAIFSFQGTWNDYFGPLIYLNTRDKWTVALALSQFHPGGVTVGAGHRTQEELLMAAAFVISLPLIVIFLTCQRLFIQGIVVSGVKG